MLKAIFFILGLSGSVYGDDEIQYLKKNAFKVKVTTEVFLEKRQEKQEEKPKPKTIEEKAFKEIETIDLEDIYFKED